MVRRLPAEQPIFLMTKYGRAFRSAGFGKWFNDRVKEAGLPIGDRATTSADLGKAGMMGRLVAGRRLGFFGDRHRSRIVDIDSEVLDRLRRRRHQGDAVRRHELMPRVLRHDHHHAALQRERLAARVGEHA